MSRPSLVRARAPAKVNLRLDVLGPRADGYHDIRTWMLALDRCDHLEARANASGQVTLAVTGEHATADIPADASNLVHRAASLALAECRTRGLASDRDGVDLALEKRIPSRAGLGGGSSDAAAAWFAVGAALGVELEADGGALATLGSDCAFFARARATGFALCEGRGDRVTAARGPDSSFFVAVVVPEVGCPTAAVYAELDRLDARPQREPDPPPEWLRGPASRVRPYLRNRLEKAALAAFPELASWRMLLDESGATEWRLSGSGSAFFGIHDRREEAETTLAAVVRAGAGKSLAVRAAWVSAPSGRGVNIVEVR
ncbi:MAG TPA: 4-(cytidine 5'-diphospho)-2-C-methyl-D-erythritol kinase [Planctomycetota bacterium]|jgi:4-diphosphocytidyl-2-C-methyl-D-erythritol kinase|nr:4-(cytidine 5'-diphospho)-2-C-methyl-D-erythritol kinase [Planctomycetota bacterium]